MGPGENVIAPAPVCLQAPATAMSQKFKPPGAFQLTGPGEDRSPVSRGPGGAGRPATGILRRRGRDQPQQLPPGSSDLGLPGEVLGPRTRDAGWGRGGAKGGYRAGPPRGLGGRGEPRPPISGGRAHKRVVARRGKTSLEGGGSGPGGQFRGCGEERAASPCRGLAPGREKP